jgi:cation:H+ antiporter
MILLLCIGLGILVLGAELLVRGASGLAGMFRISPLIIGLTIVAFGTSSPELAISIKAVMSDHPDLVTGNCIGSTLFNILFILGICGLIAPLVVVQQLIWIDVPIMIGAHILLYILSIDGMISRLDACILFLGIVIYTWFTIKQGKKATQEVENEYKEAFETNGGGPNKKKILKEIMFIIAGLVLCVYGADLMTNNAIMLAKSLGVSELVIALTVVAAGTSMPEVATSIVATIRGQRDIAIGNVIGSNIYNILGIIGLSGIIAPEGIRVASGVINFDLPVAIATCVACLPIFFIGHRIARWEGGLFFGYYIAYTVYLGLSAQEHDALPTYSAIMMWFVIPLTVITLITVLYRKKRAISSYE